MDSTKFQFHDVFGLDPDLLGMVPSPCIALLLLFPINDKVSEYCGAYQELLSRLQLDWLQLCMAACTTVMRITFQFNNETV